MYEICKKFPFFAILQSQLKAVSNKFPYYASPVIDADFLRLLKVKSL